MKSVLIGTIHVIIFLFSPFTDDFGGDTSDNSIRLHVMSYYGTRCNDRTLPNGNSWQND